MLRSRTPLTEAFGRVLRMLREEAGVSQEQLGAKSGLHRNYVGMIERGERTPSLAAVEALSRALGMRPHEIVRAAEEFAPNL